MIDEFGLYPKDEPFDPFSIMLFKALQAVAFLFFLALLAISPEDKDGKIASKAEFIITMDWPDKHPDDLDLFVQDPIGNIAGIAIARPASWCSIATTTAAPTTSSSSTAKKISSPIREEIVTIRGIVEAQLDRAGDF